MIAVLDTVAQMVGGPLTAALFSIGRSDIKGSSGVCFLSSSVCSAYPSRHDVTDMLHMATGPVCFDVFISVGSEAQPVGARSGFALESPVDGSE